MDSNPIPNVHWQTRRRQLAAVHRRIAACGLESADQAIFQLRVLAACDELEVRLDDGFGCDLGAEVLWTLVSLAPALIEPPAGTGVAAGRLPHPEVLDGRETVGRLRAVLAAYAAPGLAARWCRLLSLMFETVEHLSAFRHPGGHPEVVAECFEVLGAGAAFLESTVEGAARGVPDAA